MRTGAEATAKVAPDTHVQVTDSVKLLPMAAKAPRPGKLAVAATAVVEADVGPTSCAPEDVATQPKPKPSDATRTPSCETVMAGAGLMATIEAPPVDALASTDDGAVTFSVSTAMRMGADSATIVAPVVEIAITI
jgi:hypothetical protein